MRLMSILKKRKIVVCSAAAVVLAVVALLLALWLGGSSTSVKVEPVAALSTTYWGDESATYGTVTSHFTQELYHNGETAISEIYVKEGQTVRIGDKLVEYSTVRLELEAENRRLELSKKEFELAKLKNHLQRLQNSVPYAPPVPTEEPEPTPTPQPTPKPGAKLYSELTADAIPFAGDGTPEDPFVFLCTEDCVLTKPFMLRLFGIAAGTPSPSPSAAPSATPAPTPTTPPAQSPAPSPTPDSSGAPQPEGMAWFRMINETDPTQWTLPNGPFAARFEVHEENDETKPLLYSWAMDGQSITAGFVREEEKEDLEDNIEKDLALMVLSTDSPWKQQVESAFSNTSGYEGYTAEELQQMIRQAKQDIAEQELAVKQAEIDLKKAQLALENATVTATVNGTVRKLVDLETAQQKGEPFLVVSGGDGFYVTGTLNESLLGRVRVGDTITATSWETGGTYFAEIVKISDFPTTQNQWDGMSNPNSSNYSFTAYIADAMDLKNGMMLDIMMQAVTDETPSDILYLSCAYIRSDQQGKYVFKMGEDRRIHKVYVETGKTIYKEYVEIRGNVLTPEDYIAFPYSPEAVEGALAEPSETENLYFEGGVYYK